MMQPYTISLYATAHAINSQTSLRTIVMSLMQDHTNAHSFNITDTGKSRGLTRLDTIEARASS